MYCSFRSSLQFHKIRENLDFGTGNSRKACSEPKIRYFFPILSWIYVDNIKILRNKDLKHAPHFLGTRNPRITRNSRRRGIYLGISERIRVLYQYIISLIRIWTTQLFPRTKSSLTQGPYVQIILII